MRDLLRIAASYGLRVHASHLPEGTLGYYSPDEARIYFDLQLTPNERRTVIAHELGHAYYGHRCDSAKHERQADTYAAELLIHPIDYANAEGIDDDAHAIADELSVTARLVHHYRAHCLQKLGQRTYSTVARSRFTNQLARALT